MKRKAEKVKVGWNSYIPPDCKPMKPCMGFTPDSHINWGLVVNQLYRKSTKTINLKEVSKMCTENRLKIKGIGTIVWVPQEQSWKAKIELRLPADELDFIIEELRNRKVRIMDERLVNTWGIKREDGYRYKTESRYFDSKCEAEEWIRECFDEIVSELKEVVKKNRECLAEQKKITLEAEI